MKYRLPAGLAYHRERAVSRSKRLTIGKHDSASTLPDLQVQRGANLTMHLNPTRDNDDDICSDQRYARDERGCNTLCPVNLYTSL